MIDLAATIEAMKASGMTSDEIVRALACVQSVAAAPARTARQERNRRYYVNASEKRLKASEQDVSDGDKVSPKEVPPAPLQEITLSNPSTHKENPPKGGQKKGSRLPSDFVMPDEWRDWAIQRGLPPDRVPIEFEKLTNWAANAGAKGAKADWFKAWRNWVIGAIDNLPRNRAGPAPRINPTLAAARRLMEQMNASPPSEIEADRTAPRLVAIGGRGG